MTDQLELDNFKVFPKHTGVWEGTWIILDANCQEKKRFTAVLTQKIVNNQWVQTNVQNYADGQSETQSFLGTVVGPGEISIESTEEIFANFTTLAKEHDDRIIIFQLWDKSTGKLKAVETINLISDTERIRTTQSFNSDDGSLKGIMVITEEKTG